MYDKNDLADLADSIDHYGYWALVDRASSWEDSFGGTPLGDCIEKIVAGIEEFDPLLRMLLDNYEVD